MPSLAPAKKQLQAYFRSTPSNARAALKRIRAAIRAAAPGAQEAFSYRIPAFRLDGRPLVWYAAFQNHCSLYPMTGAIRRKLATALKGYEVSKGTVRLPLAKPIPVGLVKKLVRARIAEMGR
ncbi:MAG: hypothetical protein DMD59_08275 [Gemmatimonadetes bacterium]|nr:MAG: hypothetical protein DMD59_08275 [Gemmatimonadota bacterium]